MRCLCEVELQSETSGHTSKPLSIYAASLADTYDLDFIRFRESSLLSVRSCPSRYNGEHANKPSAFRKKPDVKLPPHDSNHDRDFHQIENSKALRFPFTSSTISVACVHTCEKEISL